jgi:clan AA aspartic protease
MGITKVAAKLQSETSEPIEVDFLVDSGAVYSVVPRKVWKKLGLKPKRRLRFALADGTTIERGVSECRFNLSGVDGVSPVVLGEGKDVALLGVVTLETLGLVFNPFDRTLKPMHLMLV